MKFLSFFIIIVSSNTLAMTITDLAGRKVTITQTPKRIICLSPGALRLISYLKATDLVVGVEELEVKNKKGRPYWLADTIMKKLPIVAPGGPAGINKIPDLEKILKTKPDAIFVTLLEKKKAEQFQKKIGIPVIVLSYGKFASFDKVIYDSLLLTGRILGKEKRALAVVNYIRGMEADLHKRGSQIKQHPTAFIGGIGFKGGHGIESTDSSYIPFEWVGVKNITKKIKKSGHFFISKEQLLTLNPDYIFVDGGGRRLVSANYKRKKAFYDTLSAFKKSNVYGLHPFNWYTTNIGSVIINAYAIGKVLYPQQYQDVNIKSKGAEIYRFLVGKDVFAIMEHDYGVLPEKLFAVLGE